jgi:hypothetical protein
MSSKYLLQDVIIPDEQQLKQLEALLYNNATPETMTRAISSQPSTK